jgi:hypothetical protein
VAWQWRQAGLGDGAFEEIRSSDGRARGFGGAFEGGVIIYRTVSSHLKCTLFRLSNSYQRHVFEYVHQVFDPELPIKIRRLQLKCKCCSVVIVVLSLHE